MVDVWSYNIWNYDNTVLWITETVLFIGCFEQIEMFSYITFLYYVQVECGGMFVIFLFYSDLKMSICVSDAFMLCGFTTVRTYFA